MTDKQKAQFDRLKSLSMANGSEDSPELDAQLILQMKTLCHLDEDEDALIEAEIIVDTLKAQITELMAKNKSDTSRLVGILLDNDHLKSKLEKANAEIERLKAGPDLNELVKARIDKDAEEVARFEQLKKNAGST